MTFVYVYAILPYWRWFRTREGRHDSHIIHHHTAMKNCLFLTSRFFFFFFLSIHVKCVLKHERQHHKAIIIKNKNKKTNKKTNSSTITRKNCNILT